MKIMKCLLLPCFLLFFAAASVQASQVIGKVSSLIGGAEAEQNGVVRTLSPDSEIFLKDRVTTPPGAHLSILFDDGTSVDQGENSSMLIDEYVYNPSSKEDNGSHIQLFRGVFKVVTDQITKLNPDRFKVSTQDGVIGIRGCAVGFDLTGPEEKVFVIDIHDVESVMVFLKNAPLDATAVAQLIINESGQGVIISKTGGLTKFEFDPADIDKILAMLALIYDLPDTQQEGDDEDKNVGFLPAEVEQAITEVLHDKDPADVDPEEPGTPPELPSGASNDDDDETPDPIVELGAKDILLTGQGMDWDWGLWAREETTTYPNGIEEVRNTLGADLGGDFISSSEFDALKNGPPMYLSSDGSDAGAIVTKGNNLALLTGSADINVQIGGGAASWDANVNVSDGGNSLNFDVNGNFDSGGGLRGNVGSYSLQAFGNSYGSPDTESIKGELVKGLPYQPAAADGGGGVEVAIPPNISGAVFEYMFTHGLGGPVVQGAAGADLYGGYYGAR